jgi:TatD DNase family protein
MSYLIDTHCHLDVKHSPGELDDLISRARDAGVRKMLWVGIDPEGTERAVDAASIYDPIYASVGVHPHDADKYTPGVGERLRELASNPKVAGIGETGLDFFRNYSPREAQFEAFRAQCEIACETGLPVIIHSREAPEETWDVISEYLPRGLQGAFHCYAYDTNYSKRVLDAGFYISINGILTYPKSDAMRSMVQKLPVDRLLLETDAPFLLPQKYRHKNNEPAFLVEAFKKAVEILNADPDKLMEQFRINSEKCFPRMADGGDS